MMDQVIRFVSLRNTTVRLEETDKFQFRKDRKHQWLQRLAIWCLRKIKCNAPYSMDKVEIVEFNPTNVARDIDKMIGVIRHMRYGDPVMVLLGPNQMDELRANVWQHAHFAFHAENVFWSQDGRDAPIKYHGLTVEVVPWMDGILVLPEKQREHRVQRR